jgi:hypothetical protein
VTEVRDDERQRDRDERPDEHGEYEPPWRDHPIQIQTFATLV